MLVRYFVTLQGCPSTCMAPLPRYSSDIIKSRSSLLRSMPVYQAQLKRTAFRSFAPGAGVYRGAAARPPRPPPGAPPPGPPPSWAGAAAGACAMAKDGALIVRATAIATLVPKIFRRTVIHPPSCLKSFALPAGIWITRPSRSIPTVAEAWQQQPAILCYPLLRLAELDVDGL